VISYTFLLN